MSASDPVRPSGPPPGLCGGCRHSRRIETGRGSVFRLCELSSRDPRFPRYPVLPVLSCTGFEAVTPERPSGSG